MNEEKMEIVICLGSSCFSRGNRDTLEVVKDYLKTHQLDKKVIFKGQLCSQSCNKGPVVWINANKYKAITATNIIPLLDEIFRPSAIQS